MSAFWQFKTTFEVYLHLQMSYTEDDASGFNFTTRVSLEV